MPARGHDTQAAGSRPDQQPRGRRGEPDKPLTGRLDTAPLTLSPLPQQKGHEKKDRNYAQSCGAQRPPWWPFQVAASVLRTQTSASARASCFSKDEPPKRLGTALILLLGNTFFSAEVALNWDYYLSSIHTYEAYVSVYGRMCQEPVILFR